MLCGAHSDFDMDYSGELFKACGIAVVTALALTVLSHTRSGVGSALRIGGAVLVFGILTVVLRENVGQIEEILSLGEKNEFISSSFSLMLKGLGIALMSKFSADVCRDCGENTLANGVETVGRVVTVSLALPLFWEILETVAQIPEL